MQAEPAAPSSLIRALQHWRRTGDVHRAAHLHALLQHRSLELHSVLGNYLVPLLVECSRLPEAHRVFDSLPHRNEYSWTALISRYIESGEPQYSLHLFQKMQEEGQSVQPNRATYLALLNACALLKDAEKGRVLHSDIIVEVVGNTLVDMYGKCSSLAEACRVFCSLPIRNAVSWTAFIAAYAEQGLAGEVLNCLHNMQLESISPNAVTYVCSLKACATKAALQTGYEIHTEIINRGLETELHMRSTLVDMYTKCCSLAEASLLCRMVPHRDGVLCTALIAGYAEHGLDQEVLTCFEEMELESVEIDAVTFVLCLKACGSTGALEVGHKINTALYKRGLEREVHMGSILVDMYGKCGSLVEAHRVLIGSQFGMQFCGLH